MMRLLATSRLLTLVTKRCVMEDGSPTGRNARARPNKSNIASTKPATTPSFGRIIRREHERLWALRTAGRPAQRPVVRDDTPPPRLYTEGPCVFNVTEQPFAVGQYVLDPKHTAAPLLPSKRPAPQAGRFFVCGARRRQRRRCASTGACRRSTFGEREGRKARRDARPGCATRRSTVPLRHQPVRRRPPTRDRGSRPALAARSARR